ncbi:MAG: C39 family peptidase [Gammaproteobacteria bacterium]
MLLFRQIAGALLFILMLVLAMGINTAVSAEVPFDGVIPGYGVMHKNVKSMRELRYAGMIRQHTDFSCGAAALASILHYAYDRPMDEKQVLEGLFKVADPKVVRERGFSLLDIKNYVATLGMRGRGYRVKIQDLYQVRVPTIVLLDLKGYKHFVVLRRAEDGEFFLADPALGNRVMTEKEFAKAWNGIIFAVIGPGFNRDTELRTAVALPTVQRFGLGAPITNAELYHYGFTHADLF